MLWKEGGIGREVVALGALPSKLSNKTSANCENKKRTKAS